jgi:hypothetical protein
LPIVNPVPPGRRLVPLTQANSVNEPHAPENNCIYEVHILDPTLLNVIVGKAEVAVNEYQTSAPGVPEHELDMDGVDTVAPANVPAVLTHDVPGVRLVAPAQLSFAGAELAAGSVTQIL